MTNMINSVPVNENSIPFVNQNLNTIPLIPTMNSFGMAGVAAVNAAQQYMAMPSVNKRYSNGMRSCYL
jgi:hypothetical protein